MPQLHALWLTSHYPNRANPVTGVFFRTQARALVRTGVAVTVAAPTPFAPRPLWTASGKWRQYGQTPAQLEDEGVSVYFPRYFAAPGHMRYGAPDRLIARAAGAARPMAQFDLIHGHYSYPQGLAAVHLGRASGKPVVITLHGDDASTYPDSGPQAMRRFKAAIAGADRVLAVSEQLIEKTFELTGRRPQMAPIGVDLRPYANLPSRVDARRRLGVDPEKYVVLFVGYLEERKGVEELVAAMTLPELRDSLCLVVGDGPLKRLLAEGSNLRCEGRQPNEKVLDYLSAADVLALPSRQEGTPTVLVEAGAADLPVVASAVGGTPDLLADSRGLLIPPRDAHALAAALVAVRTDRSAAAQRSARLRRFIQEHYDVDATAQKLADDYAKVAGWAPAYAGVA